MASTNKKTPNLSKLSEDTGICYATLYRRWKEGRPLTDPTETRYRAFGWNLTMAEWGEEADLSTKNLYDRFVYHRNKYQLSDKKALEKVLRNAGVRG